MDVIKLTTGYKKIFIKEKNHKIGIIELLKKITIFLLYILPIIILIIIYLYKENKIKELNKEINHLKNNIVIENIRKDKEMKEILSKYRSEINFESNIENNNYNITQSIRNFLDKLDKLLSSKSKINFTENKIEYSIETNNYNSTLKSQYFTTFEKSFDKYRNETELTEEYKNKFKQDILNGYSKIFKKNYTKIDIIIYNNKFNFGNALFVINNLIYYCELLGCKKIYLTKEYWFVKRPIYDKELNITISPLDIDTWDENTTINIDSKLTFDQIVHFFNDNFIPFRNYILKNELYSNVKLIETNIEDLYINIRSGKDVFDIHGYSPSSYIQPPLCFYQTIIEMFNFSNIYIISNGKENPVVDELLKAYNNTKYFHGTVEEDTAIILSAKNLVLPCSSFTVELVKLSDSIQNLFEFNIIDKQDIINWHYQDRHLRPLKFNRFIMNPTEEYIKVMKPWRKEPNQFSQMINEKCNKKFTIIPSDFA